MTKTKNFKDLKDLKDVKDLEGLADGLKSFFSTDIKNKGSVKSDADEESLNSQSDLNPEFESKKKKKTLDSKSLKSYDENEDNIFEDVQDDVKSESGVKEDDVKSESGKEIEQKTKKWEEEIKGNIKKLDRNEWNWERIRSRLIVHPIAMSAGVAKIANIGFCGILEILLAGISGEKDGGEFKDVMTFLSEQRTDPSVIRWAAGIVGYSLGYLTGTDKYVEEFFKDQDANKNAAFSYLNAGIDAGIKDIKDVSQYYNLRATDSSSTPKSPKPEIQATSATKVESNKEVKLDDDDPLKAFKNVNEEFGLDRTGLDHGGDRW